MVNLLYPFWTTSVLLVCSRSHYSEIQGKYQLFVLYLRDHCDHAGVWQHGFKRFEQTTGFRINQEEFLKIVNQDKPNKPRIVVLENGRWWITGFIEDQYKTSTLDNSNRAIKGVINSIDFNKIPIESPILYLLKIIAFFLKVIIFSFENGDNFGFRE